MTWRAVLPGFTAAALLLLRHHVAHQVHAHGPRRWRDAWRCDPARFLALKPGRWQTLILLARHSMLVKSRSEGSQGMLMTWWALFDYPYLARRTIGRARHAEARRRRSA